MAVSVSRVDTSQVVGSALTLSSALNDVTSGDLMVAVIGKDGSGSVTDDQGDWTLLLGFTDGESAIYQAIYYKEAVVADQSATNYTFSGGAESWLGIFYTISGANTTPTLHSSATDFGKSRDPLTASFTANDSASAIFAGFINDSKGAAQAIDVVLTDDYLVSGIGNGDIGCGMGFYLPGSTAVPQMDHSYDTIDQWTAYAFEVEPAGGNVTLSADSGSYAITGAAVAFALTLAVDSGSYAITGSDATLNNSTPASVTLTADSGSYTISGSDVTFTVSGWQPISDSTTIWTADADESSSWSTISDQSSSWSPDGSTSTWTPITDKSTIWS
jgi:hypothetical protein